MPRHTVTFPLVLIALAAALACESGSPTLTNVRLATAKQAAPVNDQSSISTREPRSQLEKDFGALEVLPPPTPRQISGLEAALEAVDDADYDMRHVAAMSGLMIASSGRIPPQLAHELYVFNGAPNEERTQALVAALGNNISIIDEVCGRSFETIATEIPSLPTLADRARHLWTECRFERYTVLCGEDRYIESSENGTDPFIAFILYGYLDARGGAHPLEVALLKHIAQGGLPQSAAE